MLTKPLVRIQQVLILSLSFVILVFYFNAIHTSSMQKLAVFLVLAIISKMVPASLPQGGNFTVAFIIDIALIKIYNGPAEAIYIAVSSNLISGIISEFVQVNKFTFSRIGEILLTTGERVIVVALTGLVYYVIPGKYFNFITAAIVYTILDLVFLAVNKSFLTRISPFKLISSFVRTIALNYFLLTPIAFIMAYVYKSVHEEIQVISVLLFFVPLLLVNYSVRLYMNIRETYEQTIKSLAATIEARDPYMMGHSERVTRNTVEIAQEMGYPDKELRMLQYVVLLHDVGYLEIDDGILEKPGPLTEEEYGEIKKHVNKGAEIISKIKFLEKSAEIVRFHHEYFDGNGYPKGLKGEEIPLGARIIAVADAYDAMTTIRRYGPAKSAHEAMGDIQEQAGKQFDPKIVNVFVNILRKRGEV